MASFERSDGHAGVFFASAQFPISPIKSALVSTYSASFNRAMACISQPVTRAAPHGEATGREHGESDPDGNGANHCRLFANE
jgi:hypothetical protein